MTGALGIFTEGQDEKKLNLFKIKCRKARLYGHYITLHITSINGDQGPLLPRANEDDAFV